MLEPRATQGSGSLSLFPQDLENLSPRPERHPPVARKAARVNTSLGGAGPLPSTPEPRCKHWGADSLGCRLTRAQTHCDVNPYSVGVCKDSEARGARSCTPSPGKAGRARRVGEVTCCGYYGGHGQKHGMGSQQTLYTPPAPRPYPLCKMKTSEVENHLRFVFW